MLNEKNGEISVRMAQMKNGENMLNRKHRTTVKYGALSLVQFQYFIAVALLKQIEILSLRHSTCISIESKNVFFCWIEAKRRKTMNNDFQLNNDFQSDCNEDSNEDFGFRNVLKIEIERMKLWCDLKDDDDDTRLSKFTRN